MVFAAALAILAFATNVEAQNRSAGGATGASSLGGGSSFGGSSLGGAGFGGSSFAGGGLGSSTAGAGLSESPFTSGGNFGAETAGGQNQGFFDAAGDGGAGGFFGALGQTIQAIQRGERAGRQLGGLNTTSQRRPEVRVKLIASPELRAETVIRQPRVVSQSLSAPRLMARKRIGGVDYAIADGVVTLRGVVASESQRLLAEKLFAIEPGVREVENLLEVTTAETVPLPN